MIVNMNKLKQKPKKNKLYVKNEYLKRLSLKVFKAFTKYIGIYKDISTYSFIKYVRHLAYTKFIKSLLQFIKAKYSISIKYLKKLANASLKILVSIKNLRLFQGSNGYKSFAIFLAIVGTLVITLTPKEEVTRESVTEMLKPEEDLKQMFYLELKELRESHVQVNPKGKISNIEEIGNTTKDNIQNLNVVNDGYSIKASANSLYVLDSIFNSTFGYSCIKKAQSVFEITSESISDVLSKYSFKATSKTVPVLVNLLEYLHFKHFLKECLCNKDCCSLVMFITKVTNDTNDTNGANVTNDRNLRYSKRYRESNSKDFVGGGVC